MARVSETYTSLWGELMFVMHTPDHLWRVNEGRADWFESLGLGNGLQILDLGCGNGYVDVVLARRGHTLVGVDRVQTVIDSARRLVNAESVQFVASDLRNVEFDTGLFDVVLMFGLVGLMSKDDDAELLKKVSRWLKLGGSLLVDCDRELARTDTTRTNHPDGFILWNWTSDRRTRTNKLTPELHRRDGVVVELRDPIDPTRGDHSGLHRYVYPEDELTQMIEASGFSVSRVAHYLDYVFPDSEADSYMLLAQSAAT